LRGPLCGRKEMGANGREGAKSCINPWPGVSGKGIKKGRKDVMVGEGGIGCNLLLLTYTPT